jgi:hypothetical protein
VAPNKSFYLLFSPGKKAFIFVGEGMKDKGRKKTRTACMTVLILRHLSIAGRNSGCAS